MLLAYEALPGIICPSNSHLSSILLFAAGLKVTDIVKYYKCLINVEEKMTEKKFMAAGGRGSVKDKEKLKIVLINLIRNLKEVKYKTELIKLSFLLDYLYCKEFSTKEGPTTVEYVKYNYGPYSDAFIDAFNELVQE